MHWNDEVNRSWPGHTVVREPLRLAMIRSGDRCSAKQVHMTWTEDSTMNEDKRGKNVLDVCMKIRRKTQVIGLSRWRNVPDLENEIRSGTGHVTYGTHGTPD